MTRIAAHRGGALEYGDSTPTGFRMTAAMPLEEVEFDLHPSADGVLMVHHDPTLDRTTDANGEIRRLTETEIREARINHSPGEHPISLEELCEIYASSPVDFRCEIKPALDGRPYPELLPDVITTLKKHGMLERTVFTSFLIETLDELSIRTTRPVLWLVSPAVQSQLGTAAVIELALAHGIPEIGLNIDQTDAHIVERIHEADLQLGCWAAHDTRQITKALGLGIKVFTTDRPNLAISLRENHAQKAVAT